MNRFFLPGAPLSVDQLVDLTPLAHQLYAVLRLRAAVEIILLDGDGFEYPTRLQVVERTHASGLILARRPVQREPAMAVTLYQSTLKGDKFEWVLQKGAELGVARFVPVISERSLVRPASALLKKYARWRAIVREAAEQCGRGRIPEIADPLLWGEAVGLAKGVRFLPWEEATTSAPRLGAAVSAQVTGMAAEVCLAIGPEGGWAAGEVAAATEAGWQLVSLGPRILRAETAALTAVAVLSDQLQI